MKDPTSIEELQQMMSDDKKELELIEYKEQELYRKILDLKKQIRATETILKRVYKDNKA